MKRPSTFLLSGIMIFAVFGGVAAYAQAPNAPSSPGAMGIDLTDITWLWTDLYPADGFNVYDDPGAGPPTHLQFHLVGTEVQQWTHSGLSANTQYAFQVSATLGMYESARTTNFTTWTYIEAVPSLTLSNIATNSITVAPSGTYSNLAAGSSGILLSNVTKGTNSTWVKNTNPWISSGLTPNTSYTFSGQSRNGGLITTTGMSTSKYTLAATPVQPVVNAPTPSSLNVAIGSGDANPAGTLYAIYISPPVGGNNWVQTNGTVGVAAAWANAATWGTRTVTGLAQYTMYSFQAMAQNGEGVQTALGLSTSLRTSDGTPPTGSITINSGATYTNTASVILTLSASDTGSGVYAMRFSNDGVTWPDWPGIAFATSYPWTLSSGDAPKTVYAQFEDYYGNPSITYSANIILDTTPPTGTVLINGGATYAQSAVVTLSLTASDGPGVVASMQFSNDGTTWSGWEAYAVTKNGWPLSAPDGLKTVYVQLKDAAGNVSTGTISASIILDTAPPTGSISINGGAPYDVSGTGVTLTLNATDGAGTGVNQMQFSNDGTTWGGWMAYASSAPWTLTGGDGLKTVYVQYSDLAGNVGTTSSTIMLDMNPPTGTFAIDGGNPYANSTAAILTSTVSDGAGSGVAYMQFSNDDSNWSAWTAYAASNTWALTTGDGPKTVYAQYSDAAGHVSTGTISTGITLDTVPPTGTIAVNGGAYTTTSPVTLTLSASDGATGSGVADMQFSNDGGATWSTWEPYAESKTWALTSGDGPKTIAVQYRDAAGNISGGPISADVTLDSVPPTGTMVISGGATYSTSTAVDVTFTADGTGSPLSVARFSNDGATWSDWLTYATDMPWNLTLGDGPKTVYAQLRDAAGNLSAIILANTILDANPPTGTIVINGGAVYTTTPSVTLTLTATDGANGSGLNGMRFSNDDATWSNWMLNASSKPWTLSDGDGTKTVYVQFRDIAGNIGTYSTDISLDTLPPTATISLASHTPINADSVSFNLVFNKRLGMAFPQSNVTLTPGSLAGGIVLNGTDPSYVITVTMTDPNANGTVGITVSGAGVTDLAGHPYAGGVSPLYTIQNYPGLTVQPHGGQLYVGDSKTFSIAGNFGPITPTFQWKCDNGSSVVDGPTTSSWTLSNLNLANAGDYWCEVNYDGTVYESNVATLSVQKHLTAIVYPLDANAIKGQTCTFTAVPSGGYPPVTFIWKKNGITVPGATNSTYTTPPLDLTDAGYYSVTVSDFNTDAISASAYLRVGLLVPVAGIGGLALLVAAMTAAGIRVRRKKQ